MSVDARALGMRLYGTKRVEHHSLPLGCLTTMKVGYLFARGRPSSLVPPLDAAGQEAAE